MSDTAFTVEMLAKRWCCSKDVIYAQLREGKLQGFRVGNAVRISADEVRRIEETPYEIQHKV